MPSQLLTSPPRRRSPVAMLRSYSAAATAKAEAELARCELCSKAIAPQHRHLLETESRRIVCSCDPCALRFENVVEGRFKLVPRDAFALPDFRMSDAAWENLSLPIQLAFIVRMTPRDEVTAFYPSPAGATQSLLTLSTWHTLVADNPVLEAMQPDVQALLVNRVGAARDRFYFLAPIDVCFELVGLVRMHWRGLSGGAVVWGELERFFGNLRVRARTSRVPTQAQDPVARPNAVESEARHA